MLRALAVASVVLGSCHAFGQPAARPEFEVASIKLNRSGDSRVMVAPVVGGRFSATNIPLQYLVTAAYGIKQNSQLSSAPAWLLSERYDIDAKAEGDPSFEAMLPMERTLLEDRLQLNFTAKSRKYQSMRWWSQNLENSTRRKLNAMRKVRRRRLAAS
jgi:hypothetical protein